MAAHVHLRRRSGRYYWRRRLPVELAARLGRPELALGLRTADPLQARRRARRLSYFVDLLFDAVTTANLTNEQFTALVEKMFQETLGEVSGWRSAGQTMAWEDEVDDALFVLGCVLDHNAAEALAMNNWKAAADDVDRLLAEAGLDVPRGSADYIRLSRGVLAAKRRAYDIEIRRLRGQEPEWSPGGEGVGALPSTLEAGGDGKLYDPLLLTANNPTFPVVKLCPG